MKFNGLSGMIVMRLPTTRTLLKSYLAAAKAAAAAAAAAVAAAAAPALKKKLARRAPRLKKNKVFGVLKILNFFEFVSIFLVVF